MVSEVELYIGKREGETEFVNKLINAENLLTYCLSRLENAVLLPCKVGDTVYYISATAEKEKCKGCKFYYNGSVDTIPCCNRPDDNIFHKCLGVESHGATLRDIYRWLYTSAIGKSIFLTREEAEQELKERSKNE